MQAVKMIESVVRDAEIAAILARPYRREFVPNEDGTWFARIVEFPGCLTEADTAEEALSQLADAAQEWVRAQLEDKGAIPAPSATLTYSGRFVTRVSTNLHKDIAERAALEGVSLNAFVVGALSRAVGQPGDLIPATVVTPTSAYADALSAFVDELNIRTNEDAAAASALSKPNDLAVLAARSQESAMVSPMSNVVPFQPPAFRTPSPEHARPDRVVAG